MTQILSAKPLIEKMKTELQERIHKITARRGFAPHLAVVLVGENPASVIYTRKKGETAVQLGMTHETITFPTSVMPAEVKARITALNQDPKVDGILVQRPLPSTFSEEEVLHWVAPEKDVDAFHPENAGRMLLGLPCFLPCTPAGVMRILDHYGVQVAGRTACVVGRSSIVGKPMAALLLQANATVLQCHSRTPSITEFTRQADILIAAAGKPRLIRGSQIKPGAVVIDVGIHRRDDSKLEGDVDYESASKVASAITPVPGGVGPMTIYILMQNTCWSAERRE